MLSFKSLAFAAAVAFGAFTTAFAAPAVASEVAARDLLSARSVAVIVADVHTKITPYVVQLSKLLCLSQSKLHRVLILLLRHFG